MRNRDQESDVLLGTMILEEIKEERGLLGFVFKIRKAVCVHPHTCIHQDEQASGDSRNNAFNEKSMKSWKWGTPSPLN